MPTRSIGRLPETLADRCIAIRMRRKTPQERCERLRDIDPAMISVLRRQCARFVADHAQEITQARPVLPSCLNDRQADFWEALVVIADVAGGRWPELARQAAAGLSANARENNPMVALLLDIWVTFLNAKADRFFSRTLAAMLNESGERPWAELKKEKEIDPLWLAKLFQTYDVHPRTIWMGDTHAKGYLKKDFKFCLTGISPLPNWTNCWRNPQARQQRMENRRPKAQDRGLNPAQKSQIRSREAKSQIKRLIRRRSISRSARTPGRQGCRGLNGD